MRKWKSDRIETIFAHSAEAEHAEKIKAVLKDYYPELDPREQRSLPEILNKLSAWKEFDDFSSIINGLRSEVLYKSRVHGIWHIERTALWCGILCMELGVKGRMMELCTVSALYHDIGRIDEREDREHGRRGAELFKSAFPEYTGRERDLICALIEAHSLDDSDSRNIMEKFVLNDYDPEYQMLLRILKDADALERFRLTEHSLATHYLRNKISLSFVGAALDMVLYQNNNNE